MSPLQLLASLLLTGGKGADLVIRGNVVLNRNMVLGDSNGVVLDERCGAAKLWMVFPSWA
jgi:hypothetical protein